MFAAHLGALYQLVRGAVADELAESSPGIDFSIDEARFLKDYLEAFANRHAASSHAQLKSLIRRALDEGEMYEALTTRLDEWEERKPDKIARRESIQAGNAMALSPRPVRRRRPRRPPREVVDRVLAIRNPRINNLG